MPKYMMPYEWEITVPDGWAGEYNEETRECIFYPLNSDLTVRITPFGAEKDGIPAPTEVMKRAYMFSIPQRAEQCEFYGCDIYGFSSVGYKTIKTEKGKTVYGLHIGYYAAGSLLSVNIYSTDQAEAERALEILKTVRKVVLQ